ncbi:hypothetical protein TGRH88_024190 [Toxoplasma gondii]|uniref:Transmembrane protein n=1 Tax=Toxoplasma gondii TaxID=5811 RepID=A0A7J6K860_TOXGO|nr:hypothetical protein TGRH88_024190 [Toxoplasma gondii]
MAGDFGSTWKQKTTHSSQQRDTKRETREGLLQQTGVSKGRTNLRFLRQLGPADTGRSNTERNSCRGVPLTHSNCKKLDLFPFKPQVFKPRRSSEPSASVLSLLRNPVTARLYCAQLARMERCAEEKRRLIKELRQLEELKECTFKPKLISTPLRFIARKALRRSAYPTDASSSYGSDKLPSVALQAPDALAGMLRHFPLISPFVLFTVCFCSVFFVAFALQLLACSGCFHSLFTGPCLLFTTFSEARSRNCR